MKDDAAKRPLGEILADSNIIQQEDIQRALEEQQRTGVRFGEALIALKLVSEQDVNWSLSRQYNLPFVHLRADHIDPAAVALVSAELARKYNVMPYLLVDDELTLVLGDPTDRRGVREIGDLTGKCINLALSMPEEVGTMIDRLYGRPSDGLLGELLRQQHVTDAHNIHLEVHPGGGVLRVRTGRELSEPVTLDRITLDAAIDDLSARLESRLSRTDRQEGLIRLRLDETPAPYYASIVTAMDGRAVTLQRLRHRPGSDELAAHYPEASDSWILERLRQGAPGLWLVVEPEPARRRRLLGLLLAAIDDDRRKIVTLAPTPAVADSGWLLLRPRSSERQAWREVLDNALPLEPDVLAIDELSQTGLLDTLIGEAMGARTVVAGLGLASPSLALTYLLTDATSPLLLEQALGSLVTLHTVTALDPENSEPDDRVEQAASWLGLPEKKIQQASLRRATAPTTTTRTVLTELRFSTELRQALREKADTATIEHLVATALHERLRDLLLPEVLAGRVPLDELRRPGGE